MDDRFRMIALDALVRHEKHRPLDAKAWEDLIDSIDEVGLLNPLTVRPLDDGRFQIIAGSHRYAACEALGHREIACHVVPLDDLPAEMAMIDENLRRAAVTGILLDKQLARRKEIYEALHPETKAHVAGAHGSNAAQGNAAAKLAPAFTAETAAVTGKSERTIQRAVERGEKIAPEAAKLVQGTRLDTGIYADRIKDLPIEEQAEKVRKDLAEPPRPRASPPAAAPKKRPVPSAPPDVADMVRRFIEATDELAAIDLAAIAAGCALRQRADLQNRCRSALDRFEALDAALEGRTHA